MSDAQIALATLFAKVLAPAILSAPAAAPVAQRMRHSALVLKEMVEVVFRDYKGGHDLGSHILLETVPPITILRHVFVVSLRLILCKEIYLNLWALMVEQSASSSGVEVLAKCLLLYAPHIPGLKAALRETFEEATGPQSREEIVAAGVTSVVDSLDITLLGESSGA